ncbi:MAG: heme NO-binding domain-containing protein [Acidobacteriota bacterium]
MSKVKGTKINSKINFLQEKYGDNVVEKVLGSLSPEDQSQLRSIVDLGWYEMELFLHLLEAIVQVVGKGNDQILDRMGRYGAEDLSLHAYKVYFRSGDPEVVLSKMIPIHASLNDPGEMEIERRQDNELDVIVKAPRSGLAHCRVARAFYQRCVELCEVAGATVEETACSSRGADACVFHVTWN